MATAGRRPDTPQKMVCIQFDILSVSLCMLVKDGAY